MILKVITYKESKGMDTKLLQRLEACFYQELDLARCDLGNLRRLYLVLGHIRPKRLFIYNFKHLFGNSCHNNELKPTGNKGRIILFLFA